MPKKVVKPKTSSKSAEYSGTEDDDGTSIFGALETDMDSEVEPVEHEITYKDSIEHVSFLQELQHFFNDPKMINSSGDPSTNIIDRQALRCYNVPDKKIPKMFRLIEACRRHDVKMMMTEKQEEYSGVMLDFDIYQDEEEDQITDEIFHRLVKRIIEGLLSILSFPEKNTV